MVSLSLSWASQFLIKYVNLLNFFVYILEECAQDLNIVAEPSSNGYRNICRVPVILINHSRIN